METCTVLRTSNVTYPSMMGDTPLCPALPHSDELLRIMTRKVCHTYKYGSVNKWN